MKRVFAIALCVILSLSALSITAFADGIINYTIYVTIADENGQIVVPDEPITVGGAAEGTGMPIYAALQDIHNRFYEGGAEAGFEVKRTEQYGTSLEKLWGVKNGGGYGYYVNNLPANSLDDILYTGDHLYAWIYQDTEKWSDKYCYFENNEHINEAIPGIAFTGTLCAIEFDKDWHPVSVPVKGAMITDNGEDTGVVTDENGKFTITPDARFHVYSARSDSMIMVSPRMAVSAMYPTVGITISDANGDLKLAQEHISVYDADEDEKLTLADALFIAHENYYEGGAAAGFETKKTELYGTSLEKLWGVKNGGSYGYYVNNLPANSLDDEIKNGDTISAWIYRDTKTWSDQYCYFDKPVISANAKDSFTVTLTGVAFDQSWKPYTVPIEGAAITIDGQKTGVVTDSQGKATVMIDGTGEFLLSAQSDSKILVPPAAKVFVTTRTAYVTISDDKGRLRAIQYPVSLYDTDNDGKITIADALYIAHDDLYEGGAAAGFEVKKTELYGASLEKLWGVKNGGSYGYFVNNNSAWSLDDPVDNGDYINAYVYQDTKSFSDRYCFFDSNEAVITAKDELAVRLNAIAYDEENGWAPYSVPVSGAVITVDGESTGVKTDENGFAVISVDQPGTAIVSAYSDTEILVPPVMSVCVNTMIGDADMDGYVTVMDATAIQKYKAQLISSDKINLFACDVDDDGYVTVMDATRIQKFKAKICHLDGTPYEA